MSAHRDLTARFAVGLSSGRLPPGLGGAVAETEAEVERRFAVYRNNVAVGLSQALGRRFPAIRRLVGEAYFQALTRAFAAAAPPSSPVLLAWGERFPAFLAGFPPLAGYPYLADVARIEWARGLAFHAADRLPLTAEALAALLADPGTARLALHPCVQVLRLRYAAVTIWQANQASGAPGSIRAAAPEIALVLRDRSFEVPVRAIGAADAAFIETLGRGATLLAAVAAGLEGAADHDPGPILALLATAGVLHPVDRPVDRPVDQEASR